VEPVEEEEEGTGAAEDVGDNEQTNVDDTARLNHM